MLVAESIFTAKRDGLYTFLKFCKKLNDPNKNPEIFAFHILGLNGVNLYLSLDVCLDAILLLLFFLTYKFS